MRRRRLEGRLVYSKDAVQVIKEKLEAFKESHIQIKQQVRGQQTTERGGEMFSGSFIGVDKKKII